MRARMWWFVIIVCMCDCLNTYSTRRERAKRGSSSKDTKPPQNGAQTKINVAGQHVRKIQPTIRRRSLLLVKGHSTTEASTCLLIWWLVGSWLRACWFD
jgi:hypothetical protein